jgi:hypothetical protein
MCAFIIAYEQEFLFGAQEGKIKCVSTRNSTVLGAEVLNSTKWAYAYQSITGQKVSISPEGQRIKV